MPSNWHILLDSLPHLDTSWSHCFLSFKHEEGLSLTSGTFAFCSWEGCWWPILTERGLAIPFTSNSLYLCFLFVLLLLKSLVSHRWRMITFALCHSFPAVVFAHVMCLGLLQVEDWDGGRLVWHAVLSIIIKIIFLCFIHSDWVVSSCNSGAVPHRMFFNQWITALSSHCRSQAVTNWAKSLWQNTDTK